jgi:hypothetical protein
MACSLGDQERTERAGRWKAVAARATARSEEALVFPSEPALAAELAELAVLETECCGASFRIDVAPGAIRLALAR